MADEEILNYAPNSNEASKVRLRLGKGDLSDKLQLYGLTIFMIGFMVIFPLELFLLLYNYYIGIFVLLIFIFGVIYFLFIHNFKDKNIKETVEVPEVEKKLSNNDELELLFQAKEKIAREMIERRFPAPQITNTKFNGVLDNCKEVVESQIQILNALTSL